MYQLKLKGSARKQLQALATVSQRLHSEASAIILDLREEPRPPDALAMVDEYAGFYRIRFNNHRIIYAVDDGRKRSRFGQLSRVTEKRITLLRNVRSC